jgi:hypothetical protein
MRNVRHAAALALAGALAGAPMLAHAQQVRPGETEGLGLTGPRIPALLKAVAANPYAPPAEPACETIPAELVALNQVLGVDADQPKPKTSKVSQAAKAIEGGVRSMIPYRGEIRFLTGADHKDHQLMDASQAAWARRGFLRGLEANLHCAGDGAEGRLDASNAQPLAPAPDTQVASADLPPAAGVRAAFQRGPGQPWELPPPEEASVRAAPVQAGDPAAVMLNARKDDALDGPGR